MLGKQRMAINGASSAQLSTAHCSDGNQMSPCCLYSQLSFINLTSGWFSQGAEFFNAGKGSWKPCLVCICRFFYLFFFAINGLIVWKTNSKLLFTHVGSVSVFQSTSQTWDIQLAIKIESKLWLFKAWLTTLAGLFDKSWSWSPNTVLLYAIQFQLVFLVLILILSVL